MIGKFFLFIWRWVMPMIGLAAVGLVAAGYVYIYFIYDVELKKIEDENFKINQIDARITSPNGARDIVLVRFDEVTPKGLEFLYFNGFPYADGFIYIVESGTEISWTEHLYEASFDDNYDDGNDENRFIKAHWVNNEQVLIEYCGVGIDFGSNFTWINDGFIEIEIQRSDDCPANVKIGEKDFVA